MITKQIIKNGIYGVAIGDALGVPYEFKSRGIVMSFVRGFNDDKIENLSRANPELYELLRADISCGLVFPAVRNGELHFYYMGGCLYKCNGRKFLRDRNYNNGKYDKDVENLDEYSKAKKQNENRFANAGGVARERQRLDTLNKHTFGNVEKTKVVVLDVEVCFRSKNGKLMKCDLVLLNTETNQIMFVEGKIFSDKRVNVLVGSIPEVAEQVKSYSEVICEQDENIVMQYGEHIKAINKIFGTIYNPQVSLITVAKLLVYETPRSSNENGRHSKSAINSELGADNVAWFVTGEEPGIDEIWGALCR